MAEADWYQSLALIPHDMAGADPDLSMRGGVTSIWGWNRRWLSNYNNHRMLRLNNRYTDTDVGCSCRAKNTLDLLSIENKQEQDEQANKLTDLNQMKPESRVGVLNQVNRVVQTTHAFTKK